MGFVAEDTHGLSWIDLDRDRRLDLVVAIGAQRGFGRGDNQVYRNLGGDLGDATLRLDPTPPEVLRDPHGRGRCLVALDLDRDGLLDVAVLNLIQAERPNRLAQAKRDGAWAPAGGIPGLSWLKAECLAAVALDPSGPPTLIAYGGGPDSGRAFRLGADSALSDVTGELGIPTDRFTTYAVAPGDYDNDGDLDLYLVRGLHVPPGLTETEDGLRFRLVSHRPGDDPSFTFRCAGDLTADVMVGNRRDRSVVFLGAARRQPPEVPWVIGRRDPAVEGAPPEAGRAPGVYVGRPAADRLTVTLVGDGGKLTAVSGILSGAGCSYDILAASEVLRRPWPATPDLLLRNDGGRFEDVTRAARLGDPRSGRDAVFFDAENDGDLDLFVVHGGLHWGQQPDALYLNRGDGTFVEVSEEAGIAGPDLGRGATVTALDYDRDGDIDLFVTNGDGPPLGNLGPTSLWRNDTAPQGGWVEVDLAGGADNPFAIGARVLARFGDRKLLLARASSNGRFSTGVLPFHFGLGDAGEAEIEVRWPSGRTSRAAARASERLVLAEPPGGSPPEPPGRSPREPAAGTVP
jgi:hypothetical protein